MPCRTPNVSSPAMTISATANDQRLRASTLRVAYGTSKAAIIHLTKQYAVELANYGVRVNAVCPGPVETEMAKQVHTVAVRSDYYDAVPLGRYGTTEEMANLVGFLCSKAASYVNGQYIANDGGFYFSADLTNHDTTGAQSWAIREITRQGITTQDVPEPLTVTLFAAGLSGIAVMRRRRKKW